MHFDSTQEAVSDITQWAHQPGIWKCLKIERDDIGICLKVFWKFAHPQKSAKAMFTDYIRWCQGKAFTYHRTLDYLSILVMSKKKLRPAITYFILEALCQATVGIQSNEHSSG